MKKELLLLLTLLFSYHLIAGIGEPKIEWKKTLSFSELTIDKGFKSLVVDDGYIVIGHSFHNRPNLLDVDIKIRMVKLNQQGDVVWQRNIAYSDTSFHSLTTKDIIQVQDGGYIIPALIYKPEIGYNGILIKVDQFGNKLWEKTFLQDMYMQLFMIGIEPTSDGGFITVGHQRESPKEDHWEHGGTSSESPWKDVLLMKFDAEANLEWKNTYDFQFNHESSRRDNSNEFGKNIIQLEDGCYFVASDFVAAGSGLLVLKVDPSGGLIWKKKYLHSKGGTFFHGISKTPDNNFVLAGFKEPFESSHNEERAWLLKIDSNGNYLWEKDYHLPGHHSEAYDMKLLDDGGFVIVGEKTNESNSNEKNYGWIFRTDKDGNIFWEKEIPTDSLNYKFFSVELTSDNGILATGSVFNEGDLMDPTTIRVCKLSSETIVEDSFRLQHFRAEPNMPTIGNYQVDISMSTLYENSANIDLYEIYKNDMLLDEFVPNQIESGFHNIIIEDKDVDIGESIEYTLMIYNTSGQIVIDTTIYTEITEDKRFRIEAWAEVNNDSIVTVNWNTNWEESFPVPGHSHWGVRRLIKNEFNSYDEELKLDSCLALSPEGVNSYSVKDTISKNGTYGYAFFTISRWNSSWSHLLAYILFDVDISRIVSSLEEVQDQSFGLRLYPNPTKNIINIKYSTQNFERIVIDLYDSLGKKVTNLLNEQQNPGSHSVKWDTNTLKPGIYYCRLQVGNKIISKQIIRTE